MRPFSLGHLCALSHLQSPFVSGELPDFDSLVEAAYVCAGTWRQNRRRIQRLDWLDRLTVWLWGKLAGRFDIMPEMAALSQYIRAACEIPEARKPKHGRRLYSEWNTRLYSHLRSLGYSDVDAMDMPLELAQKLFVAHLEETGSTEFMTEREDHIADVLTRSIVEAEAQFGAGQEIRTVTA